ncbi:MAG: hypothetical protein R2940_15725 [Syntrophotaleaceae bacterium]
MERQRSVSRPGDVWALEFFDSVLDRFTANSERIIVGEQNEKSNGLHQS